MAVKVVLRLDISIFCNNL